MLLSFHGHGIFWLDEAGFVEAAELHGPCHNGRLRQMQWTMLMKSSSVRRECRGALDLPRVLLTQTSSVRYEKA